MPFDPDKDIPDLSGKVIIVTGGSSGLGKESALQLAKHNPAAIYLTARTRSRGEAAIDEIVQAVPAAKGVVKFIELDLGSFASIQKAANVFLSQSDRLDILMNNAGLLAATPGLTTDGYEVQFGSNFLGPTLLTRLLLPMLLRTAEAHGNTRVIDMSSELFRRAPKQGILLSRVKEPLEDIASVTRYGHSKLATFYHTRILSQKYPSIKFVAIHPGVVNTGIFDDIGARRPWLGKVLGLVGSIFLTDVHTGAKAQLWASTTDGKNVNSGAFYNQKFKEYQDSVLYHDDAAQKLYDWTVKEFESNGL